MTRCGQCQHSATHHGFPAAVDTWCEACDCLSYSDPDKQYLAPSPDVAIAYVCRRSTGCNGNSPQPAGNGEDRS